MKIYDIENHSHYHQIGYIVVFITKGSENRTFCGFFEKKLVKKIKLDIYRSKVLD